MSCTKWMHSPWGALSAQIPAHKVQGAHDRLKGPASALVGVHTCIQLHRVGAWREDSRRGRDRPGGCVLFLWTRVRVSIFGFRVSGFGFRVSGFGFWDSGFEFRDSRFAFRVSRLVMSPARE